MVSQGLQKGTVLISVLVALAIMAAIIQLLNLQQGMLANSVAAQHALAVANGVAEAGLRDALFQARKGGLYPSVINGSLPGHGAYEARIVKDASNPSVITITSRANMANTAQVKLERSYSLVCPNGTTTSDPITTYTGAPRNIIENNASTRQAGYLHPRDNTDDRSRSLIWFYWDTTNFPSKATIASASLMLDVENHDPAMEGATLYVNRIIEKWSAKDADWRFAEGTKQWTSPGGAYTLVNEARASISGSKTIYEFNITAMMQEWHKGTTNYGLILRTDGKTSGGTREFRLKKNTGNSKTPWPRIVVKWC